MMTDRVAVSAVVRGVRVPAVTFVGRRMWQTPDLVAGHRWHPSRMVTDITAPPAPPAPVVDPVRSPRRHKPGCAHCARVRTLSRDYRAAREAAELAREAATCGYATETAAYGPLITFRDWLVATAGQSESDYAHA